jgi:hypothetical protein
MARATIAGCRAAGVACVLMAGVSLPAAAQDTASGVALVIAQQPGQPASQRDGDARRDADRIAQRLTALGYRVLRVDQPSLARFDEIFREFEQIARNSPATVLFYAGPTTFLRGDVHANTTDGRETVPLVERFGQASPVTANRIMIVDGCRIVGPSDGGSSPQVNAGSRMFVALANSAGRACPDRGPLSPFTTALDQYLGEGITELAALMDKTRTSVLASTKDQQVPWDISTLARRTSLLPPIATTAATPAIRPAPAPEAPRSPSAVSTSAPPPVVALPLPSEPPAAPRAGPSQWWHNGSLMELRANGRERAFHYVEPRAGIARMGVDRGTLLFQGERTGDTYAGIAYIFRGSCGRWPYRVSGTVSTDQRRVIMTGQAPLVDARCNVTGARPDELVFDLRAEE